MRRGNARGGAAIALCQIEPWTAILQFAAALRRRGVWTVRHTEAGHSRAGQARLAAEALSFRQVHYDVHVDPAGAVSLDPEAILQGVRDVQASERIWEKLIGTPQFRNRPDLRRSSTVGEEVLIRKDLQLRLLGDRGIAVPESVPAVDGLPVVWPVIVKRPIGYGGTGVRLVDGESEFQAAAQQWGIAADEMLVEPVLGQPQVNVGGVADQGRIVLAAAYSPRYAGDDQFGPPARLQIVESPDAMHISREAVALLGLSGPFCFDFMTGPEGPILIDVNARIFGSWLALQRAGLDVLGAYLWRLGLGSRPTDGSARVGESLVVDFGTGTWRTSVKLLSQTAPYVGVRGAVGQAAWALAKE